MNRIPKEYVVWITEPLAGWLANDLGGPVRVCADLATARDVTRTEALRFCRSLNEGYGVAAGPRALPLPVAMVNAVLDPIARRGDSLVQPFNPLRRSKQ